MILSFATDVRLENFAVSFASASVPAASPDIVYCHSARSVEAAFEPATCDHLVIADHNKLKIISAGLVKIDRSIDSHDEKCG